MVESQQQKNAVCIVVDGLPAHLIGAYGNTWTTTPEVDQLAAESCLIDPLLLDGPKLENVVRSLWTGRHALAPFASSLGLAELAASAGLSTVLLTDDRLVADSSLASGFTKQRIIERRAPMSLADDPDSTHLARFFLAATRLLDEVRPPFLLWLHVGCLAGPWDAPYQMREQFAGEDDPPPPRLSAPPCLRLPDDHDPDFVLGIQHAAAGQLALFDACLGTLAEQVRNGPRGQDTLLTIAGARGFPLGEHGRIGFADEALYGELIHVPWILRFPDGTGAAQRCLILTQTPDVAATLMDWFDLSSHDAPCNGRSVLPIIRGESPQLREQALCWSSKRNWALRTTDWHLRVNRCEAETASDQDGASDLEAELFAKPDDYFEVNEVASRCADDVATLYMQGERLQQSIAVGASR